MESSDTGVGSLLGHKADGVVVAGMGEVPHLGPLVLLRVILQYVLQNLLFVVNTTFDDNDV